MAKCPSCNNDVSYLCGFPNFRNPLLWRPEIFPCSNCGESLKVTAMSKNILYLLLVLTAFISVTIFNYVSQYYNVEFPMGSTGLVIFGSVIIVIVYLLFWKYIAKLEISREVGRTKFYNNPIVKVIMIVLALSFLVFLIYNIFLAAR